MALLESHVAQAGLKLTIGKASLELMTLMPPPFKHHHQTSSPDIDTHDYYTTKIRSKEIPNTKGTHRWMILILYGFFSVALLYFIRVLLDLLV